MKRGLALAVLGVLLGGCGGGSPQNSPPGNSEARRAKLHDSVTSTPFKHVVWESVLRDVAVTHVSLREDSLFVEGTEKSGDRRGLPVLYRINVRDGVVEGVVDLPKPLDFRPQIVASIVREIAQLQADRDKLMKERQVEATRKDKNVQKLEGLSDQIVKKTDLINSLKAQDRVYGVSSSDWLHVIERPAMAELERERLAFVPSTAAAASPSVVFMGAWERNRLIGLDSTTWAEILFFPAGGDISTTPIIAEPGNVYFASEDGHVYGYTVDGRNKLIDYATEDAIVCDMCLDIEKDETGREKWGSLFVASTDYALYCFNRTSGELRWKYETGTELRTTPSVSGDVAYVYARDKGLHAIDKKTGKLLYIKKDAWFPIARGKDRVYLAGPQHRDVISVEERTGKELGKASIADFGHVVSDPRLRTVYLVTDDGFCFAAKESEIDY